ncbi:hypothetical protein H0S59_04280 [Acinetobacter nosocomialis]|uniref:hypothetical protein n=1 Tax=Acinetobacter nosocomialis TaxID=106654 RepID=UPI000DD06B0E|nr:hypothetical protein [Acinetobacter nosocomialis]QPF41833.1 hypothetical protein H0S59_04280 [Acinetobacter nosocomialis]
MDKCREEFQKAFPIPAHWIEFDEKANRYYCPYVADATASTYQSKWVVWQHQQAKVEELKASHHGEVIGHEVHFKKIKQERDELQTLYIQQGINMLKLQKRVDAALKETQFALQYVEEDMRGNHEFLQMAMIRTLKALEQALKGDQYDEHHKKAEEAISKGASLTNHRIEL